ncbi:MAG TPA: hypothetical protein PLN41_02880 [Methanothrix sp.]|jgi:hypothetical protein|nr:hypothetical protein [Methanothrix sp.]
MFILISLIGIALIILKYAQLDINKGLIFISGALLLNFTYYAVYDMLSWKWQVVSPATIIYALLFIILIIVTWRATCSQAKDIAQILGVVTVSMVIIGLGNLALSINSDAKEISYSGDEFEAQFQRYLAEDLTSPLNNRDFYFIILDRYPGEETLNAETGFYNEDFYNNLSSMGFTIIEKSRSNYGVTLESLPSILNMDYYNSVKRNGYNEENNRLWRFFRSQGFDFVFLPSNWVTTTKNDYADIILNPYPITLESKSRDTIFQKIMFFELTFIGKVYYSILHIVFNQDDKPASSINALQMRIQNLEESEKSEFNKQFDLDRKFESIARYHVPYTFDNLTQVPNMDGKKYVFAHINHWEYLSNPNETKVAVVNQLVESAVEIIISESDPKPVIVIMSDHGDKPLAKNVEENRATYARYACYPNESIDQDDIQASWYTLDNIAIFYLPEGGDEFLYPNITPVNAWRMILNYYFNTSFPPLDDRCYWKWRHSGILEPTFVLD